MAKQTPEEFKIPEEFKDRPEQYFVKLEKEEYKADIKKLENTVDFLRAKTMKLQLVIVEIDAIVKIRRRRINAIRHVLTKSAKLWKRESEDESNECG